MLSTRSFRASSRLCSTCWNQARYASTGRIAKVDVLEELDSRGFIQATTSPLLKTHLEKHRSCIYSGVDPSANSLHVGNLLPLLGLLHFSAAGHKVLALVGGATGSIGDPSGRTSERQFLTPEELNRNVQSITSQVHKFFERGMEYIDKKGGYAAASGGASHIGGTSGSSESNSGEVQVLNNLDWFKDVSFLEFLRTTGKMARVNVMLSRDSVKNRLQTAQGISFTEFSYQLLQAHDFAHLHKHHDCRIQLGGSDQWGNIVAGIDLIKRQRAVTGSRSPEKDVEEEEVEPAYGLTIPLMTTSTGEKFGKSAGNAVWLDESRTSVSDFYQFFIRSYDEDVEKYLRSFTMLPVEHINDIMRSHRVRQRNREAQTILAREVTELVHGPEAVERAEATTHLLYKAPVRSLKSPEILEAFKGDKRLRKVTWKEINKIPISKLMVTFGMVKARADASRLISSKSVTINDLVVNDPRRLLSRSELVDHRLAVVKAGSRNQLIFYVED